MKKIVFIILLAIVSISSRGADYLDGYVVFANNDTMKCKFKLGGFIVATNFFNRLTIVNDKGEEQLYKAHEKKILAYGFVDGGRRFNYQYFEVEPKVESGFYQRINNSPRYKLFRHMVSTSGGVVGSVSPVYVLLTPAGNYVRFDPCIACPWKRKLRKLLQDDPKALDILENQAKAKDIPAFVLELNKEELLNDLPQVDIY